MSVLLFFVTAIVGYVVYTLLRSMQRPANYPPGPVFLPWIGNIMQLRKEAAACGGQHIVFETWAQKYKSNILGLKLGKELVVVVLSYPLVHEVHLEEVFEGRPDNFFLRLRTMGTRMGITCTDGPQWHEHRNFAMKQMRLVGYGRTKMEQHIEKEVASLLTYIKDTDGLPVFPGAFLAPSVINVLWSLTAGKRIKRDDKQLVQLLDLLNKRSKVFDLCGGILTQFSFLRYIAPNKTGYNLIRQLNEQLQNFFRDTINDHKRRLTQDNIDNDFIFAYIREMQERSGSGVTTANSFNEKQLTMTILDLFIAGSQTTSNTMILVLMMLSMRTDLQESLWEETAAHIKRGSGDFPHLSSNSSYPKLNVFIMEVQRFFHITPITGPRRALWDTTLGGYSIPKNTTVLIGLRAVHMDKEHWRDPECFRPQRFINDNGQIIKDEYFMPFGQGRRRCLGDSLARACLFTFLVKIIENFKIESCQDNPPSMTLQPGITLSAKPFKIKFIQRS